LLVQVIKRPLPLDHWLGAIIRVCVGQGKKNMKSVAKLRSFEEKEEKEIALRDWVAFRQHPPPARGHPRLKAEDGTRVLPVSLFSVVLPLAVAAALLSGALPPKLSKYRL
jgi:hypothetical protein